MKRCFKCGKEKSLDEFYKHSEMADGHLNKCKECTRKDVRERELHNPMAVYRSRLVTHKKNPTHANASRVVDAAVKAGVIQKPSRCSGCGCHDEESRITAHHYDYTKPLDVVWVCSKCHRQLDANRREREGEKPFGTSRQVAMLLGGVELCRFDTIKDAAKAVGRSTSSIHQCLSGISKKCAGVEWKYCEE